MLKNIFLKINFLPEDLDLKWIEKGKLPENDGQLKSHLRPFCMILFCAKTAAAPSPPLPLRCTPPLPPRSLVEPREVFSEGYALLGVF